MRDEKRIGRILIVLTIVVTFVLLSFSFVLSDGVAGELKSKKANFQRSSFLLVKLDKSVTFDSAIGFKGIDGTSLRINALNQEYGAVIEKSSPQYFSSQYNQKLKEKYGEEGWYKVTVKDKKSLSRLYKQYRKEKSFIFVRMVNLRSISSWKRMR